MEIEKIDELHALIQSLDASERRHFSLFSQRHQIGDGNHYALLFKWMAEMETYDPVVIAQKMKAAGFRTPLAAAKNHLKSLLLRAMRDYRTSENVHARLLEGLGNLAFFHEKKQYGLLQKEIERLKKLATLHGEHHVLFKIGDYERRLYKETARREIATGMEAILGRMKATATAFQNQMEYTHLLDRLFLLAKTSARHRDIAIIDMLAHPLLTEFSMALTPLSQIYFHQIHAIGALLRGLKQEAMQHYAQVVALWEAAPHLIRESPSTYRRILNNYLGICHLLDEYAPFPAMLAQIRQSPSAHLRDRVEVFNFGTYYELLWRMGTWDWPAVADLLPEIQRGLQTYASHLDEGSTLAFCYNAAIYLFLAQDYSACRRWLRDITDRPSGEQRMDIQRMARLLGLLCSAALDDLDLLEHQLRATQRHFEKRVHGSVEAAVMALAHDWLHSLNRQDQLDALSRFIEALSAADAVQELGAFELQAWAMAVSNHSRPLDMIRELKRA